MKLTRSCCSDLLEGLLRLDHCINLTWYYQFFCFCFASIYISLCVFNSVHMFFSFSSLYCMRSIGLFLWLTLRTVILYFLIHCIAVILSIIKILKEGLYVLPFSFLLQFDCLLLYIFKNFIPVSMQINSFQYHWNKFVQVDMDFNFYGVEYPIVPEQPFDNS